MADLDLRPLSLGELLDRIISLYRKHFWLFVGINAVPQLLVLLFNLLQTWFITGRTVLPGHGAVAPGAISGGVAAAGILVTIVAGLVYLVTYLFAQGGTVYAVSELYLGRTTTVRASLQRMHGHALQLFAVSLLNGLAVVVGFILLIIPGIYVACRLMTCIPAALVEDLGPSESLSRSWDLTRDNAGRAFLIYVLYIVFAIVASAILVFPFGVGLGLAARDPAAARVWRELTQVGTFCSNLLVVPFFTIAAAVFYFDLRVRKEAFDLQLMMNPNAVGTPASAARVPSILS